VKPGVERATGAGYSATALRVVVTPNGYNLITASADGRIKVWSLVKATLP
jgi:hypothetical protein